MGIKLRKKFGSRGATLPEYAIVLGVMVLAAVAIHESLWETSREESAQQEACVSQIPPPPLAADGSGCEIPTVSTTTTLPGQNTTTTTTSTTIAPAQPSAPQNLTVTPLYDAAGLHYLDVAFTPPANVDSVPVATYQYSTDGGVKWKTRSSGTTGSPLRIEIESNTFNARLLQATDYDVAIRAVTANGVTGKRSAVWRTGTAKALLRCGDGTFCPDKFSIITVAGARRGLHRVEGSSESASGQAYFTKEGTITLSVVAGGGGGGGNGGGGGGAGGYVSANVTVSPDQPYYFLIAGGGGAAGANSTRGRNGLASLFIAPSFAGYVAYGGGGGSARDGVAATPPCRPSSTPVNSPDPQSCPTETFSSRAAWDASGGLWSELVTPAIGSAGGGANTVTGFRRAGGNGKTGEGSNGGWGCTNNGVDCAGEGGGGGGGGRGGNGGDGLISGTVRGGSGGSGILSNITGTFVSYAAGGGGGKTTNGTAGLGGSCSTSNPDACVGGSSRTGFRLSGMDGRGAGGGGGSGGTAAGRGGGGAVLFSYSLTHQQIAAAET
jgi:hypothetical protein